MAPKGQLKVGRYFALLAFVLVGLYALVFFTGPSGDIGQKIKPHLGLDLQGGTTVTLRATVPGGKAPKHSQLEQAREIIENRVNGTGVAEFEVLIEGDRNLVINVPGKNQEDVRRIGEPAQLRFREVLKQVNDAEAGSTKAKPAAKNPTSGSPVDETVPTQESVLAKFDPTVVQAAEQAQDASAVSSPELAPKFEPVKRLTPAEIAVLPANFQLYVPQVTCALLNQRPPGSVLDPKKQVVACEKDAKIKYLLDKSTVLGTDVKDASFGYEQGQWKVVVKFKGKGQDRWTDLTKKTVGKQVAIVLDNQIVSAPNTNSVITGPAEISGSNIGKSEAEDLANKLKYGALPLNFTVETTESISPTLGTEYLKAGLLAGGIGLALVVVYSLLYYRALGLVTIASLIAAGAIVFAAVVLLGRSIGFTLTLAGVAGFIVAVGITADSFVVFFERIKDEVKEGRSVRSAVPKAWSRARRTILSADFVSFLAAAVLYFLAVGAVKGFAFTLGLSTLVDLFIVMMFTHPLVSWLSRFPSFTSPRITGLGGLRKKKAVAPVPGVTVTSDAAGGKP